MILTYAEIQFLSSHGGLYISVDLDLGLLVLHLKEGAYELCWKNLSSKAVLSGLDCKVFSLNMKDTKDRSVVVSKQCQERNQEVKKLAIGNEL